MRADCGGCQTVVRVKDRGSRVKGQARGVAAACGGMWRRALRRLAVVVKIQITRNMKLEKSIYV